MNIFKNYKFYIIVSSIICIIAIKICAYFGVFVNSELAQEIATYVISALIAYNVITINTPKDKMQVKKDVSQCMQTIQNKKLTKSENKNQKENKNIDAT